MAGKPPIWTEPLELVCDGTPLVFRDPTDPTDEYGDYILVREDGLYFTLDACSASKTLFVNPEGKYWSHCGPNDPVLVRNRVQMDAPPEVDALIHASMGKDFERRETLDPLLAAVGNPTREPRETLRDKFAMAALTGLLAAGRGASAYEVATLAAHYADAMMAERDKGGEA